MVARGHFKIPPMHAFHTRSRKDPRVFRLGSNQPTSSMSVPQVLQHLCALDRSSPDFFRSLYAFIRLDEGGEYSLNLQHSDSVRLVDFLDRV